MPEARATKKIFKWNPLTTRPRGRPKYRWEDNIIQDLGQMEINNWLTRVQDRAKWKDVEKAKTSYQRRFSAWRRRRRCDYRSSRCAWPHSVIRIKLMGGPNKMNWQMSCIPQDACFRSVTKSVKALKIAIESTEEINCLEPHCIFNVYSRIIFFQW